MLKGDIVLKALYISPITFSVRTGAEWLEFAADFPALEFVLDELTLYPGEVE